MMQKTKIATQMRTISQMIADEADALSDNVNKVEISASINPDGPAQIEFSLYGWEDEDGTYKRMNAQKQINKRTEVLGTHD